MSNKKYHYELCEKGIFVANIWFPSFFVPGAIVKAFRGWSVLSQLIVGTKVTLFPASLIVKWGESSHPLLCEDEDERQRQRERQRERPRER